MVLLLDEGLLSAQPVRGNTPAATPPAARPEPLAAGERILDV
jgi:hypothetical protein